LFVRVLGSAAGGGFPQWNCGCGNCSGVRNGTIRAVPRTQESVAVSADGDQWFLLNASPEVRQQLESFSALYPRSFRDTPVAGVLLTNGDLDHCLGLLSLRESQRLVVYATDRVRQGFIVGNVFYKTLERFEGQVTWHRLRFGVRERLLGPDGKESGLTVAAFPLPGKPPLHSRDPVRNLEDNVGLSIIDERSSGVLAYLPGVAGPGQSVSEAVAGADAVFFDGTFWTSDELTALGGGTRKAEDMAHWPLSGASGSLEFLRKLPAKRRILIHLNNTNPLLRDDSPEREVVRAFDVDVAFDGMEFSL
jgi:pyrroloquinoline quinone biosynthesis protein B